MKRRRDYEVAQTLGRRIEVDTECRLHIFWGRDGEEEVEHVFDDIEPAIRQEQHVIEEYVGFMESFRGRILIISGESQVLDGLVRGTMDVAKKFLGPKILTRTDQRIIQQQLENLIIGIGEARNISKVKFRIRLEKVRAKILEAEGDSNHQTAEELYKAAEDGLVRLEDIARKLGGVGIRLQILLREEKRVKKVIKSTYISLHRLLVKLQEDDELNQKDLGRIANQVSGGKTNLINGLESIWIPPYGQRVRSHEVRRLKKLSGYAASGDQKRMSRALLGAFTKLRPVVKKMEDRRKAKAKRWIPR